MKVTYDGPLRSVQVRHVDGRRFRCRQGESVDLPHALAERLLEQDTWKAAKSSGSSSKKKSD